MDTFSPMIYRFKAPIWLIELYLTGQVFAIRPSICRECGHLDGVYVVLDDGDVFEVSESGERGPLFHCGRPRAIFLFGKVEISDEILA